jgi:hypothetical protein
MPIDPLELHTPDGWLSIDLYDPGTFDFEPIEVYTQQGWKVPYFRDPSKADTPIELYTQSNGWMGLNSVGILRIDDFEDGDHAGWTVPSSTGSDTIVSGLHGTDYGWRLNGFREAHLAGADAVDRGPQQGDTFEYSFQIDDYGSGSALFRFEFACSGTGDGDRYRVEYEINDSDPDTALYKQSGGSTAETSTFKTIDPAVGDVVRAEIRWNVGDSNIEVDHYLNGSFLHTISITDTAYTQPGVCLFVNSNLVTTVDEIRILP